MSAMKELMSAMKRFLVCVRVRRVRIGVMDV